MNISCTFSTQHHCRVHFAKSMHWLFWLSNGHFYESPINVSGLFCGSLLAALQDLILKAARCWLWLVGWRPWAKAWMSWISKNLGNTEHVWHLGVFSNSLSIAHVIPFFLLFPDFESLQEAIAVRFPAREAIMIVRSHLRCSRPGS